MLILEGRAEVMGCAEMREVVLRSKAAGRRKMECIFFGMFCSLLVCLLGVVDGSVVYVLLDDPVFASQVIYEYQYECGI